MDAKIAVFSMSFPFLPVGIFSAAEFLVLVLRSKMVVCRGCPVVVRIKSNAEQPQPNTQASAYHRRVDLHVSCIAAL